MPLFLQKAKLTVHLVYLVLDANYGVDKVFHQSQKADQEGH